MSTHHDDIPFHIQAEIIKRIPKVKSLIQFRSVSKPWKSLIDSSKFIATYKSTNHHLLVTYDKRSKLGCGYVSVADDDSFPQHNFRLALLESVEPVSNERLVGISQGLFCIYSRERKLDNITCVAVVWNPSIRKSVTVQVPEPSYIGFGVCPRTSDPKIVSIKHIYKDIPTSAEIFTLSSGAWRSLSINLPNNISDISVDYVDIDGILYWHSTTNHYTKNHHYRYNRIITFDLTSEEFGEVCLPDRLRYQLNFYKDFSISKLNESLVALEYRRPHESQVCNVWMMEHGAIKKLFTIKAPFFYMVKGFRMNGQAIIENSKIKKSILKVYDPCTRHVNDHDLRIDQHLFFKCCYQETLLLFDRQ